MAKKESLDLGGVKMADENSSAKSLLSDFFKDVTEAIVPAGQSILDHVLSGDSQDISIKPDNAPAEEAGVPSQYQFMGNGFALDKRLVWGVGAGLTALVLLFVVLR